MYVSRLSVSDGKFSQAARESGVSFDWRGITFHNDGGDLYTELSLTSPVPGPLHDINAMFVLTETWPTYQLLAEAGIYNGNRLGCPGAVLTVHVNGEIKIIVVSGTDRQQVVNLYRLVFRGHCQPTDAL
jgi:hypothetical protein